jgi:hypothetical protein
MGSYASHRGGKKRIGPTSQGEPYSWVASVRLEVVHQHPSLEGEYPLRCFLEHLPQFRHVHPSDISHFLMLWDGLSVFDRGGHISMEEHMQLARSAWY